MFRGLSRLRMLLRNAAAALDRLIETSIKKDAVPGYDSKRRVPPSNSEMA